MKYETLKHCNPLSRACTWVLKTRKSNTSELLACVAGGLVGMGCKIRKRQSRDSEGWSRLLQLRRFGIFTLRTPTRPPAMQATELSAQNTGRTLQPSFPGSLFFPPHLSLYGDRKNKDPGNEVG